MALDQDHGRLAGPAPAAPVPVAAARRPVPAAADRIRCQIQAIDAWNAARRMRERVLEDSASRYDKLDARRQLDVLQCTQRAIADAAARTLRQSGGPMLGADPTAVIAHRHTWFADEVSAQLSARGVLVLACTDNGAEALGTVIAEQPDLVLTGELLVMMTGRALLAESRSFAPASVLAVQTDDAAEAQAWRPCADAVFVRHDPPADVTDALLALLPADAALS